MTRAFARTTDRLAVWQTQLMAEALAAPELEAALDEADARAVPDLGRRRRRRRASSPTWPTTSSRCSSTPGGVTSPPRSPACSPTPTPEQSGQGVRRVVGFADLVNFTSLVRRMTERQLAVMVQRFEALATDIVTAHGGRVIKTVGDEILFVTPEPAAGSRDRPRPGRRRWPRTTCCPTCGSGMAVGPVVSRLGDVFGTTVNRASRLTGVAPGGGVLVDDALAAALAALSGFETTRAAPPHPARHRAGHPQRAAAGRRRPRPPRRRHHPRGVLMSSSSWSGSSGTATAATSPSSSWTAPRR